MDESSEAEKLRKEIQFLTDLINNAQDTKTYHHPSGRGGARHRGRIQQHVAVEQHAAGQQHVAGQQYMRGRGHAHSRGRGQLQSWSNFSQRIPSQKLQMNTIPVKSTAHHEDPVKTSAYSNASSTGDNKSVSKYCWSKSNREQGLTCQHSTMSSNKAGTEKIKLINVPGDSEKVMLIPGKPYPMKSTRSHSQKELSVPSESVNSTPAGGSGVSLQGKTVRKQISVTSKDTSDILLNEIGKFKYVIPVQQTRTSQSKGLVPTSEVGQYSAQKKQLQGQILSTSSVNCNSSKTVSSNQAAQTVKYCPNKKTDSVVKSPNPKNNLLKIGKGDRNCADQKRTLHDELLKTQSKIETLKKCLSDRTASLISPIKTPVRAIIHNSVTTENKDLLSLSPYKLERVGSRSPSKSPQKQNISSKVEPVILDSTKNKMNFASSAENVTAAKPSAPSSSIVKSKYSFRRINSAPPLTSLQNQINPVIKLFQAKAVIPQNQAPAKLLHKSRFSLKRHQSLLTQKGHDGARTPTKLVSMSKYALKRVRRSLSDGDKKKGNQRNYRSSAIDRRFKTPLKMPFSSQNQHAAKVIRSKYKIQKISIENTRKNYSRFRQSNRNSYKQYGRTWNRDAYSSSYYGRKWTYGSIHQGYWNQGRQSRNQPGKMTFYSHNGRGKQCRNHTRYPSEWSCSYWYPYPRRNYTESGMINMKYVQRKMNLLKKEVPFNPQLRLDRRKTTGKSTGAANLVMINGLLYKSSRKSLVKTSNTNQASTSLVSNTKPQIKCLNPSCMKTVTVKGVKFQVNKGGKSLQRIDTADVNKSSTTAVMRVPNSSQVSRIDIGGVTYVQSRPGTLERVGSVKSRVVATRAVNRSLARTVAKHKKDTSKSTNKQQYCMFYNRFGKCNRKTKCSFIHDPDKIAVCTRFLRGTCKVTDCPFSHKVAREKMPVCSYFLKGVCNKDDCPYLHVNVSRDAEICSDFVNGFCPLGEKCKKKHTLVCPIFSKTGSCPEGIKCKLQHRKSRKRKSETLSGANSMSSKLSRPSAVETTPVEATVDDSDLPFRDRKLPAYISLKMKNTGVCDNGSSSQTSSSDVHVSKSEGVSSLKIRPQF